MDAHDIKPVAFLRSRLEELDLAIPKRPKEPLVSDIAHAIECKLSLTFLQKHWLYENVVRLRGPSVVIEQSRNLKQVQSS